MAVGRLAFGIMLGTASLATPAWAQEERTMDIGLRLEVERDNNISRSDDAAAQRQGVAQEDTIMTPSLTVDIRQPFGGQQALFLNGSVGYAFYDKNEQLDRQRAGLQGGVEFGVGPCGGRLTGDYQRGQSELSDVALSTVVDNVIETTRVQAEAVCATATGIGVTGSASQAWVNNSAASQESGDSEERVYQVGVTYGRPALGTFTIFGQRVEVDYPNRGLLGGGTDGYELDAFGLTYSRKLGARIEGQVTAAYTNVTPGSSPLPGATDADYSGTTYDGSISYRASSRLRLQADFSRAVTPTLALRQQYQIQTGYSLAGSYDIGSRFNLTLGGSHFDSDADGTLPAPANILTSSTTKAFYGALRYQQSERLSLTLRARHEERDGNGTDFDFSGQSYGIAADVTF